MSTRARRLLLLAKAAVLFYWVWLLKVSLWPNGSQFDGFLASHHHE